MINLDLLEKSQALKFTVLNQSGVLNRFVSLDNLLPMTFYDCSFYQKRPQWEWPVYIDEEMVYFSRFTESFYLFDKEGSWVDEGVGHPLLSIDRNYDEYKWHDSYRMF